MFDPNRDNLERVVCLLAPLLENLVLAGGCATGLLITDNAAGSVRPTKDVDAIVNVASRLEYYRLGDKMRALGFREDSSPDAPPCRWRNDRSIVDLLPTDCAVLGFSNRWYAPALSSSQLVSIAGYTVRIVDPVHFVATKLEAFRDRGQTDISFSHDHEDVISVVDGRPELFSEVEKANVEVRNYVASTLRQLLSNPEFVDALSGFILPDPASQARRALLESRLRAIAELDRS